MDPLDDKLEAMIAEWEREDPGSTDIEQPPREMDELPDLPQPGAMVLPEMDLSGDATPASPATPGAGQEAAPPVSPRHAANPEPSHPAKVDPKSLDWKGLSDALRNAELRQMQSRAGDRLRANAGEAGAYRTLPRGDEQVDLARMPLDLAKEKQGMDSRDLSMQSQRATLGAKDALDNPNSLQSQKAREAWRAFGLPTPPGFSEWSANEIQRNMGAGTSARGAADKNADDAARARAAGEKAKAGEAALEQMRKTWTPELKAAGKDPSTASKFDIEQVMGVVKAREGRAFTAGRDDDKDVRDLSGKLGDPASFTQKYDEILRLAKENGGEIPGLGALEGMRQQAGIIGSATRAVSPSSPDAIKGRKLLQQLSSEYARAISGAGVSDTERTNLQAATIDVNNEDSAIALSGLQTLKEMYDAKVQQLKRGYRPEVVKRATGADGPVKTRPIRGGGTAYQGRTSGKWFTTPQEAEAN